MTKSEKIHHCQVHPFVRWPAAYVTGASVTKCVKGPSFFSSKSTCEIFTITNVSTLSRHRVEDTEHCVSAFILW